MQACSCVGGASVFYGGVSFRFRTSDFKPRAELRQRGSDVALRYADLEPHYSTGRGDPRRRRRLAGADPGEPPRSRPFPHAPAPLSPTSQPDRGRRAKPRADAVSAAAGDQPRWTGPACHASACTTCDTFACAVSAKNDVATAVLPELLRRGLEMRPRTLVTGLKVQGDRITEVEAIDTVAGERVTFRAGLVLLGAGALSSPHLILASGLAARNPAGHAIGGYLTRHCVAIVYGLFKACRTRGRCSTSRWDSTMPRRRDGHR